MTDDTATEEQFVDFKCPHCGDSVSFPASVKGTAQECVSCGQPVIVPEDGGDGRPIPLPIATAGLTLRKFRDADWKNLLQLFSDDDFSFGVPPYKLDGEEQVTRWLEYDASVKLTAPGVPLILAVETLDGAKVIGSVSLSFTDADRTQATVNFAVHRDFRRRGFGAEAVRGALGFCFDGIALHRVQAFCDSTNTAACGLLQKIGLRREGEFVRDHKIGDEWANTAAYALLREEFKTATGG